jgi:hypothetical protein
MRPNLSFLRIFSSVLVAALVVASSSCIHWPAEPYMDAVATPTERESTIVRHQYPDAEFIGPVYRRHMSTRRGYQIVSHVFLFNDDTGILHRGEIDTASRLTTRPAKLVSKLPDRLHTSFFDGSSAMVPGGRIDGRAWLFSTPDPVYEFRFDSTGGSGFGRIMESGNSMSAYHLR